jgi:ubiquinone/menaquinone biosynthesis C-methylase UbiE
MTRITSHFQTHEPLLENLIRKYRTIIVKKHITKGSDLLDLGCGYHGYFLNEVKDNLTSGLGLDIKVGKNISKKIRLKKHNLDLKIPVNNSTFDTVTAMALLEHVNHPLRLTKEVYRVLKKRGTFLITTPTPKAKVILEFLTYRLKIISKDEIEDHKQYLNEYKLKELLMKSGFKKNRIKISTFELGLNLFAKAKK